MLQNLQFMLFIFKTIYSITNILETQYKSKILKYVQNAKCVIGIYIFQILDIQSLYWKALIDC